MNDQSLTCPNCGFVIRVDLRQLLYGGQLTCPGCMTEFTLDRSGSREALEAMQALEMQKQSPSNNPGPD